jgi:mono/diheme cytochrome c family protein
MSEQKHNSGPHPDNKVSLEQAAMQDEHMQEVHAQLMREKEEPQEGFSPVPIFLMFLFAALCFWGGVYLVHYSGDFRWDVYNPKFDPGATQVAPPEISLFARGEKIFRNNCAVCHQGTGLGVPGVYPPIAGSEWVTEHPQVLARVLINGLNGPIEVKGNKYNGNMPAFGPSGSNLSDKDLAGVMTYIRQEWGNDAPDMTVAMVEEYKALYASRSTPWNFPAVKEDLGEIPSAAPAAEVPATEAPEGESPEQDAPADAAPATETATAAL